MKPSPCKDCTDRVPMQCHKSCDRYKKWKSETVEINNKMRRDRDIRGFLSKYN